MDRPEIRKNKFIHEVFEDTVLKNGSETALIFNQLTISYKELNEKADQLSNVILNCSSDSKFIGISTTRSIDMVIGILAILKSGKAYLPLDPTYPEDRLKQIISDSGTTWCITFNNSDSFLFQKLGLSNVNSESGNVTKSRASHIDNSLAYILYTSGSTGKPKGVCMGHSSLINLIEWQKRQSQNSVGDKTLQFAPLSFDVSFQEIFATLTTGGTLVIIDDKLRLDPLKVISLIIEKDIRRIYLPFIALQYLAEMAVSFQLFPACLKEVITAGEQLKITPQIVSFFSELPDCILCNQYGPTECHVVSELRLNGIPSTWPALPSIGRPIDNTFIFIFDEQSNLLTDGNVGELCIAGECLSEGYLNKPELTLSKFTTWNHPDNGPMKIYKTGDLAKYLPNGEIEFLGRKDDQVKIRGNRVELGEIEVVLTQLEGIKQATVIAREDLPGQKMLVAYLISHSNALDSSIIRDSLTKLLPEYMIPTFFVWMTEFPKTSSGKVDKKLLPKPDIIRPDLASLYKKPVKIIEKNIAGIWSAILQIERIGIDDNFFELGGNSILAQRTVANLKNQFNYELPITKLYQFPTVSGIVDYLEPSKDNKLDNKLKIKSNKSLNDIAIIGMSGRFPGADSVDKLWDILKEGKETIRFFTAEELDKSINSQIKNDPDYISARGILDEVDKFDAAFFGINPKLAELMDPQQRVFLEISWELLEISGYSSGNHNKSIGVFAGSGNNTYYLNNVQSNQKLIEQVGGFQVMTVNEKDYISSRTAYELNLRGPAVSVFSGCSTSLLAITQAVESLRNEHCDLAIAGGVSITSPVNSGHIYQEGAMLSSDGHCRPFDDNASGTVFSDGAGAVLLKNLSDAIIDGDTVYAIIKGVGLNNDGGGKGSFTAPSAEGQAGAIKMAIENAGIEASSISYIEAHGTGTPLGDPIEIEGLKMGFGEQASNQFCALGSVKGNLGHLTGAAGVTGLIKTTLALYNNQIPASIGYERPNRNIDFKNSPFYVNNKLSDWPENNVKRAGVSSFGVGGTNVHVVLEAFENKAKISDESLSLQLISWSAKSNVSREKYAQKLAEYIRIHSDNKIADIAYTLHLNRADFNHRRFIVASSNEDFLNQLLLEDISGSESKILTEKPGEIIFSFPGQGSQYLNMGRELYLNESVYKNAIDECAVLLQNLIGLDIRNVIYPEEINSISEEQLKNTRFTQPAIFITEYALAKLWMSWGIMPSIFCGHSIGEFVAAHFAGVFNLPDAIKLIASRGAMVSELPKGSMLSVRLEESEIVNILPQQLSIAAVNNKKLCVVAGPDVEIAMFSKMLDNMEIPNRVLVTSHAFHSAMMDPIIHEFEEVVKQVILNKPQKPIISTVNGDWLKDEQAIDPLYWANHLRKTVKFSDALEVISHLDNPLFLEVGPGNVTSTLARQQFAGKNIGVITSIERSDSNSEYLTLLKALGVLWLNGVQPDWNSYYQGQNRAKLKLPTYAFDKKYCWVEPISNPFQFDKTNYSIENNKISQIAPKQNIQSMRKETLRNKIKQLLEDASGIEMNDIPPSMSFLEIGLDSLLLTQVALTFKKEFGLPITFRQLSEAYSSPALLIDYLDLNLPKESYSSHVENGTRNNIETVTESIVNAVPTGDSAISLIAQQIQLLSNQIALMQNGNQGNNQFINSVNLPIQNDITHLTSDLSPEEAAEIKKPFGATARIDKQKTALSDKQAAFLKNLTERYNKITASSKAYAQKYRSLMADPRVVSGFKPLTKEIVYPIVVNKSKGSRLWDIDGNEYIDALNGFGASMLGHQPDFIKNALKEQIEKGYEVGPQHELAGEVCELICEFTGHDRSALCSTGSEAVLGAMRIARTVTGRSLIVAFNGSYHGIVDEVIVRGTKKLKSYPAAPGIMPEAVQNMLILDYGTEESLRIIKDKAHELAAVLVEPVQSRRPEFVPIEFLKQVRQITTDSGTALIFDEVITGFRMHPGGAQAMFGIKADIATYGKVVAAGIPIGVIAGKREYMDALDGGYWQYGDESYPEIGVTYFAGTFVRHPLALASAKAALNYMKQKGPDLQKDISKKAGVLADTLNLEFEKLGLPLFVARYGSLWKIKFKEEMPYSELLFTLMREKGVHIWDGFPCFMTEAHTDEEVNTIIMYFKESINELIAAGFFIVTKGKEDVKYDTIDETLVPPVDGARLGRDQNGSPAWFINDPDQPGKYLLVK